MKLIARRKGQGHELVAIVPGEMRRRGLFWSWLMGLIRSHRERAAVGSQRGG